MTTKTMEQFLEIEKTVEEGTTDNVWMLLPVPIKALAGPKNRKRFLEVVRKSRAVLIHHKWGEELLEEVRMLSERGGIEYVDVHRIKRKVIHTASYCDGKQVNILDRKEAGK